MIDEYKNDVVKSLLIFILAVMSATLSFKIAYASSSNAETALTAPMCAAVRFLTGTIARIICLIIAFFIGVMLLLGKLQWGPAIGILAGVALALNAKNLLEVLDRASSGTCE